jgi:hypothetical protein
MLFEHCSVRAGTNITDSEQRFRLPGDRLKFLCSGKNIHLEYIGIEAAEVAIGLFKLVTILFPGGEQKSIQRRLTCSFANWSY